MITKIHKLYVMTEKGDIQLHHFCTNFVTAVDTLEAIRQRISSGEFTYIKAWISTEVVNHSEMRVA